MKNAGLGIARRELTSSCSGEPEQLSALAFSLLFRFQGAEALGTHRSAVEVPVLPAIRQGAGLQGGVTLAMRCAHHNLTHKKVCYLRIRSE